MNVAGTGWRDLLAGAYLARVLALAGGVVLHAINVFVAFTVLPSAVLEIGGLPFFAWNTVLFVVASIVASALAERAMSRFGPRGAYRLALGVFAVGTLACAAAPSMAVMLLGRTLQGVGGGLVMSLSYATIRLVLPEPLWPRTMALISGVWGVASLLGPALGGVFADLGIWRGAFWTLLAFGLLVMLLVERVLVGSVHEGEPRAFPIGRLGLLAAAAMSISAAGVATDLRVNATGVGVAVVLVAALVVLERRGGSRLLPRGAFDTRSQLGAAYATMALLSIALGPEVFVPYLLQLLHGLSPLGAGYVLALLAAGWTTGSVTSSSAGPRGAGIALRLGPLVMLSGLVLGGAAVTRGEGSPGPALVAVGLGLGLMGLGIGMVWPHLLTRILRIAPPEEQEAAAGSITTVQLSASAFGSALAGMVANTAGLVEPGGMAGAASAGAWLFGVFAVAAGLGAVSSTRVATRT